jgi:hypothetical protein
MVNAQLVAVRELSDAEKSLVCGYSLPTADKFFHYLFALGAIGKARLRRFWVFDPDKEDVKPRFRRILRQMALERFEFFPETFETALRTIPNKTSPSRR